MVRQAFFILLGAGALLAVSMYESEILTWRQDREATPGALFSSCAL